jgi:hypothetical protein
VFLELGFVTEDFRGYWFDLASLPDHEELSDLMDNTPEDEMGFVALEAFLQVAKLPVAQAYEIDEFFHNNPEGEVRWEG